MAGKENIQETEQKETAGKNGKKKLIIMGGVIIISVLCAFVFVTKVYPSLIGEKPEKITNQSENISKVRDAKMSQAKEVPVATMEESILAPLDTIIVNLSGSNSRRYLKAKIVLEVKNAYIQEKVGKKSIQIKDRLISILSSRTIEDIDGPLGQDSLRQEIKDAVDVVLKEENGVVQVYFEEFVVQ